MKYCSFLLAFFIAIVITVERPKELAVGGCLEVDEFNIYIEGTLWPLIE